MQKETKEDNNLNESKQETSQHQINEDFTFSKSPMKTPRSIGKINNNQYIKTRIEKDEKIEIIKRNENENNQIENLYEVDRKKRFRYKKEYELESNKVNSIEIEIPSLIKQRNLAPKTTSTELVELEENNLETLSYKKKKKDWKSWSSQEKELFYEAIANGGNYSSLQKLFKNMNNVYNFLIFRK
jgi:hypothetical protein